MHKSAPQPATRKTPTGGRKMVIITMRTAEFILIDCVPRSFIGEVCCEEVPEAF